MKFSTEPTVTPEEKTFVILPVIAVEWRDGFTLIVGWLSWVIELKWR